MARKQRIGLMPAARAEVLVKIEDCRRAVVRVLTEYPIRSGEYQAAQQVMPVLNNLRRELNSRKDDQLPKLPLA